MRPVGLGVWPPLPPSVYVRRPKARLPFPLGELGCALFARARHGLWHAVQAVGLTPGDELLVPAYHHGSEVEALRRARLGLRFYDATPTLEPDEPEVERLLGPRVRGLYLVHYLGFPQDSARWRAWCDERGLLLIEDAAQAWLADSAGTPVGSTADIAIFCLYKTFGVPDGAALFVRGSAPVPSSAPRAGFRQLARVHALWLFERLDGVAALGRPAPRPARYVPEEDFALGDPDTAPTAATLFLLPRLADDGAAARRRANYERLLRELRDRVRAPFAELPPGASPFAFPVESDEKPRLLARLAGRGVVALDFWSLPHPALPGDRFPGAAARRLRTIALPVHQELRSGDVDRIVDAVRSRRVRPRPLPAG